MICTNHMRYQSTINFSAVQASGGRWKTETLQELTRRTKIGLVFSGGGARGTAHVGVMQSLNEAGIQADMVVGTSIGALGGLMYCARIPMEDIVEFLQSLMPPKWLARLPGGSVLHLRRLLQGGGLRREIEKLIPAGTRIEDLPIPFRPTCLDLNSGERITLSSGDACEAVIASMSLPGLGRPMRRGQQLLVDGGLVDNLPADILREYGIEVSIGVDLGVAPARWPRRNRFSLLPRSVRTALRVCYLQQFNAIHLRRDVDVMIRPQLSEYGFTEFGPPAELLEIGAFAARKKLGEIEATIHAHHIDSPRPRISAAR